MNIYVRYCARFSFIGLISILKATQWEGITITPFHSRRYYYYPISLGLTRAEKTTAHCTDAWSVVKRDMILDPWFFSPYAWPLPYHATQRRHGLRLIYIQSCFIKTVRAQQISVKLENKSTYIVLEIKSRCLYFW